MDIEAAFSKEILLEGFMQAPMSLAVLSVPDYVLRIANPFYLQMVDRSRDECVGMPLFDIFPEAKSTIEPLLDGVVATGKPYYGNEVEIALKRRGKTDLTYFNFVYQPVLDASGAIEGILVVAHEVTALIVAKHELRESEEKFRFMVSQSPIPMAILRGADWVIEMANEAILRNIWAKEWGEVKGRKLMEVFPDLKDQPFPGLLKYVFSSGKVYSEKEKLVRIDGQGELYVDFDYTPLFNHDGSVSGIMVTVYDVTERVAARRKTEENEERLRMVIEASGLGTWELDLTTGGFDYSDKYLASFGITERLSHRDLLAFMHPEDLHIRKKSFEDAFQTGLLHYVSRLRWRDQSIHWIEAHGKVLYDEFHKPLKMIGTSRDITEERLNEQSTRENEQRFRLLADSLPQFIWTGDVQGNLNYFNRSVYDYTGFTFEQLKGQAWVHIVHPDDRVANVDKWREAVRKGDGFLFEHRIRRYDGVYRWQLSRATPQLDENGNIQLWVGTSTDIHDQKAFAQELEEKVFERTQELKQTNEVLEKTNRELEQFAYIASHDLQEPLRKIQTFADILRRNMHDEVSVQKYFSKISSSAQRMGELIRSVLDYSRLPSDPAHLMLTDLNEVVDNVRSDLELLISEKGARIESDPLPAIPGMPLQLHQLFANLIGNGLKFSRTEPCIRVSRSVVSGDQLQEIFEADPFKQYLQLQFQDNGIGFDSRYKDQIFTIFQRLHGLQQYAGTGIGLALCKKIVENHLGHITAVSEQGKGSTFIVYLPA